MGNSSGGGVKKKILIVDDEADVRVYLETLFQDNGYATITADDGKQAMETVLREAPDLITLDISMPEESGVRMYRTLQEDAELSKIPIIIVTGLSSDFKRFMGHMEKRQKVSAPAGYFEKPIDKQEILNRIKELIG